MNKARKSRDRFLEHIMKEFPFEGDAAAGVYYDEGLEVEMTVAGNEVLFKFQGGTKTQADKR